LKDTALELVATEDGDPLLAFWPIGLGRTAVFASDVKDRWATDWLRWRGYGPFFAALLHAIERQRPAAVGLEIGAGPVRGDARSIAVAVEARTPTGGYRDLLKPTIRVESAGGSAVDLVARQVAPGRYEANVIADASKRLTISVAGQDAASSISRVVVPDPGVEYRFRAPDLTALESIARATGGKVNPAPADISNTADSHPTARRALWPALVFLALGLWLADIFIRRVRFFEPAA